MKLKVDKSVCIGCGACQATCPSVFVIDDDGFATTVVEEIKDKEIMEDALDAMAGCPISAIEEDNGEESTNKAA